MPQSDTWPGGVGMDTMTGTDSAGSCDSVVSAHSGFSDDSLEHLSAEEKACLMFLEETIESLDTEDDSGLSNDEPDHRPHPGNLAARLADLSTSMSRSSINGSQTSDSMDTIKEDVEPDLVQHYFVPTPFVLASCSVPSLPKRGLPPEGIACAQPHAAPSSNRAGHQTHWRPVAPPVPVEANVVVPPPPPTRPRDFSGRTAEPRGPLSYEALVYLRRSASTKKTPLCPKVDHTIDTDGPNLGPTSKPVRSCPEASKSKVAPPVVAPKPKRVPTSTCVKTPNPAPVTPDSPCGLKTLTDPEEVRLAALHKLGLLKESDSEAVAPPPSLRKCHSSAAPTPDRSNTHPSRSPSFCYSQAPPEAKSKPLQSSASFHHRPRSDQQSAPDPPSKPQATCLRPCATLDSHTHGRPRPEPVTKAPVAQPGAHKPSNAVGYTVMMVPGMGADRKEALRKLGLLKEQ